MFIREVIVPLQSLNFISPIPIVQNTLFPVSIIVTEFMQNGSLMNVLKKSNQKQLTPGFGPTEFNKSIFGILQR
jgi:hypothetical protein